MGLKQDQVYICLPLKKYQHKNMLVLPFNKMPLKIFWSIKWTRFFQEMGKTKFNAIKTRGEPSAQHNLELFLDMWLGV